MTGEGIRRWRWVALSVVLAVHDRQIAEHGGREGIRDLGLIDSALSRPVNLAASGDPDAANLATAYAHGLISSHGLVDGNNRTAWVAARLFLLDNGYQLSFDPFDAIRIIEDLASGRASDADLAVWFRNRLVHRTAGRAGVDDAIS